MEVNLSDITVAIVSFHAPDAFALTWESFLHHHRLLPGKPRLIVYDNGSDDDLKEYFAKHAELVIEGDNTWPHGENLTRLCSKVETPYVLTADNDLEFLGPVVPMMLEAMQPDDVYGACLSRLWPFGEAEVFGERYHAQYSPNIAMGLMKMGRVRHILQYVTFGYYYNISRKEFFETGAMFWRMAEACGWRMAELFDLWHVMKHYGQISQVFRPEPRNSAYVSDANNPPENRGAQISVIERRYTTVQERLARLRAAY